MKDETEWILERIKLYQLMRQHPDWSNRQYARELGHEPKWVRKWKARIEAAATITLEVFRSHSRAPKTGRHKIGEEARQLVCQLRQQLSEKFHRKAGARTIAWGLREYNRQHPVTFPLPTSRSTIHQILHERGYIPTPRQIAHEPLVLPAPLEEWEVDFGEVWLKDIGVFEFFIAVDRGTSRLIYLEGRMGGYNAESTLEAVTRLFIQCGLPNRLRFDRDVRLWGAWTRDSYPSPFVRFLRVLGVKDVICPPRRPDLKPVVERCIQTLKYEWFGRQFPTSEAEALALLDDFPHYYNDERPHQGQACGNRPPSVAFPNLPLLPQLPNEVDPDRWLHCVHQRIYRRRVNSSGTVQIDRHTYSVGTGYAKQLVLVHVDAKAHRFHFSIEGRVVKTLPIHGLYGMRMHFWDYFRLIQSEARLIELHHATLWEQMGDTGS
jgi:transposase InsO family protein